MQNTDNQTLLDDLLYKERFSVERTNAWIDALKLFWSALKQRLKLGGAYIIWHLRSYSSESKQNIFKQLRY